MEDKGEFRPSDVVLSTPPLTACFKKTEAECAAALPVWYMQKTGDCWQAVAPTQLGLAMNDEEMLKEPLRSWNRNPFFRPDFQRLLADGYITESREGIPEDKGGALLFTDKGLEQLRNSVWVRKVRVRK